MRVKNRTLLVLMSILLVGCSSSMQREAENQEKTFAQPTNGMGAVYIYRPYGFIGGGRSPALFINNKYELDFENDSYYYKQFTPGSYVFQMVGYNANLSEWIASKLENGNAKSSTYRIQIKPNQNYYLKYDYLKNQLSLVLDQDGQKGVNDCDRIFPETK